MEEDISGSHWGDAISANPTSSVLFSANDNPYANDVNVFADDLQHNAFQSEEDENDENNGQTMEEVDFSAGGRGSGVIYEELGQTLRDVHVADEDTDEGEVENGLEMVGPSEEEIAEIKAKKSELLSSLAGGADDQVANPFKEPTPELKSSDGLFMDSSLTRSPLANVLKDQNKEPEGPPAPIITSPNRKTRVFKSHRPRRTKKKETVEDAPSGPVDPLAQSTASGTQDSPQQLESVPDVLKSVDEPLYDVHRTGGSPSKTTVTAVTPIRRKSPSTDRFDISVGDPIKVGELTTAHIEYTIKTKTKSPLLKNEETEVNRRYRDFRWLYHQLVNNHPGYIIPPPPEKQVYGRFEEKFIESRRIALEKMLTKISQVDELQKDYDFVIFLSSERFSVESKERENLFFHGSSSQKSTTSVDDDSGKFIDYSTASLSAANTSASGGFMSAITGAFSLSSPKYIETDPFFIDKPAYIENLDHQLRSLAKTLELIVTQREETIASLDEFLTTIQAFIDLEINNELANIFTNFEDLNIKIKELLERTNMQEMLTLGSTIDEYSRVIGSIRIVFETRFKICNNILNVQSQLSKKQKNLGKFKAKFHNQFDKIDKYESEIQSLETQFAKQTEQRNEISATIKDHLALFEEEKIDDFRSMVEIYWEGLCETQKVLIELWESFYEKCNFGAEP
ncbi:unnamed protein product [Kuraishia capsulata CBS 1993]|uniref:PX domain-containing protein n=1 Tax=Kuraishia capsulata CBS 1993 TaxID=1382522 RepID=W6MPE4_9ASCO|nr:uncharacterized protein KUCA_T00004170001 [Kuraishia capsulata CBS 1993]CDK28188.1 unnamed protein product [Kuraishia capsulata CBS 1993]